MNRSEGFQRLASTLLADMDFMTVHVTNALRSWKKISKQVGQIAIVRSCISKATLDLELIKRHVLESKGQSVLIKVYPLSGLKKIVKYQTWLS